MRQYHRNGWRNVLAITGMAVMGMAVTELVVPAGAALGSQPVVDLDGTTQTISFSTPPIYDLSLNASSEDGGIANATLVSQDQKGNLDGVIVDKGADIEMTTDITGTIKRSGDIVVIKEKLIGEGKLSDGDTIASRATKRSEVRVTATGAEQHTELKIKTCTRFKKPFSDTYATVCSSGGGTHDTAFNRSGDWTVTLTELAQNAKGELSGFGKLITNVHSSEFKRETDVIIGGKSKDEGLAKIKLTSLFKGGDGPVTLTAQLNGVNYPAVLFVLEAKGKLLGQKFAEVYQ